jgi:hypothetical protein
VVETEQVVTELLKALGEVRNAFWLKTWDLRSRAHVSEISFEFEIRTPLTAADRERGSIPGSPYEGAPDLQAGGWVDAEIADCGGVGWHVHVTRDGSAWELEREVTVNAGPEQETIHELPTVRFPDSVVLAAQLRQLVDELLAIEVP